VAPDHPPVFYDLGLMRYGSGGGGEDGVFSLLADGDRIWVGHRGGLDVIAPPFGRFRRVVSARGPADHILALERSGDGTVWAGTQYAGLIEIHGEAVRRYGPESGIANGAVRSLREDGDRNLWIGTESRGVIKQVRGGLISYGREDGPRNTRILCVAGDRAGQV